MVIRKNKYMIDNIGNKDRLEIGILEITMARIQSSFRIATIIYCKELNTECAMRNNSQQWHH